MMLTELSKYEIVRLGLAPFLLPLHKSVRSRLLAEVRRVGTGCSILDVGGRKSPYTIGVPARVTVIDLPRETEIQNRLNLGVSDAVARQVKQNRTNIAELILGDMTCSALPDASFDLVVSVEVLEHVEEDRLFVSEVARVLKPGGTFLMTTPNGDFVENKNPDHKRHYKRSELHDLLASSFADVSVDYCIAGGRYRRLGLRSWSARRPLRTLSSAIGNIVNGLQSSRPEIAGRASGTHHLFAVARKSDRAKA